VVGRVAALTAVYAIEHRGPQAHSYTLAEFRERYRENFGAAPELDALSSDTNGS
jgi:adenosine kinase